MIEEKDLIWHHHNKNNFIFDFKKYVKDFELPKVINSKWKEKMVNNISSNPLDCYYQLILYSESDAIVYIIRPMTMDENTVYMLYCGVARKRTEEERKEFFSKYNNIDDYLIICECFVKICEKEEEGKNVAFNHYIYLHGGKHLDCEQVIQDEYYCIIEISAIDKSARKYSIIPIHEKNNIVCYLFSESLSSKNDDGLLYKNYRFYQDQPHMIFTNIDKAKQQVMIQYNCIYSYAMSFITDNLEDSTKNHKVL